MSPRSQLIRQIAELAEEDVAELLGVVERLRAKQPPTSVSPIATSSVHGATRHPERFGTMPGSVQFLGDVELPVEEPGDWTFDAENVGS